ncbi:MAG: LysM peptidoglycan-binding domain-containing protein [candidate division WOR-3 bacterium]
MKKIAGLTLLTFLLFGEVREHVVKKGDTLWDIAGYYYNNPFAWVAIWKENMDKIKDPHWIYPGQVFVIPEIPPEEAAKIGVPFYPVPERVPVPEVTVLKPPLPAVAPDLILSAGFVDFVENVKPFAKLIDTEPKGIKNLYYYQKAYIDKGSLDGVKEGDLFLVYDIGPGIKSKRKGSLGNYFKILGKIKVLKVSEKASCVEILPSYDLIHVNNLIMPISLPEIPYDVKLVPSTRDIKAQIVYRTHSENEILKPFEIVIIDAGEEDGVKIGDLFEIYREKEIKGVKAPYIFLGTLQVLNVKKKSSTCYIRSVTREDIKVGDYVRLVGEISK